MEKKRGWKGRGKQAAATVLAAIFFLTAFPQNVYAWNLPIPGRDDSDYEEPAVVLSELSELPAPTENPAKGYFGMKVAKSVSKDSAGNRTYTYRETYLPVITDGEKRVYGKLDSLEELLGLSVFETEGAMKVVMGHTAIYFALGSPVVTYATSFFTVQANIGLPPLYFEDAWYVPLDAFLEVTGCYRLFEGETSVGTEQLVVIPPQETILDRMGDFLPQRYSRYMFRYGKDLGVTDEYLTRVRKSALLSQLVNRLWKVDPEAWGAVTLSNFGFDEEAQHLAEKDYIQIFADSLLMMEKEQVSLILADPEKDLDVIGILADLYFGLKKDITQEELKKLTDELLYKNPVGSLTDLEPLESGYDGLRKMKIAGKGASTGLTAAGYLVSYHKIAGKLKNGDSWMVEASKDFMNRSRNSFDPAMDTSMRQIMEQKLAEFEGKGERGGAILSWLEEHYGDVITDGLAFLEVGYFGTITMASTVWELGTDFWMGKELDATEAALVSMYGELYERDALTSLGNALSSLLTTGKTKWTAEEERYLRHQLSNVVKASYVARNYGMVAQHKVLESRPELKGRLTTIQKELLQFLIDFSDLDKPLGRMPQDLANLGIRDDNYYPNVVFNIAEITGQIRMWKTEKPAKQVRLEIYDVDGALLAEGTTDDEGSFDIAFEMGDIDSRERDDAGLRKLNLHLYYKKDPVITEVVEIKCFHKYQIEGLRAGERSKERLVYLREAREENGKTVLMVQEIDLGEKPWSLDMPDWQGGTSYTAYFSLHGDVTLSEWKSFQLRDQVRFGSVYTAQTPENGLVDSLLYLSENMGGMYPDTFTNREMHTAEEINAFIADYREYVHDDPVYVLETVNSEVKGVEPSMVNPQ